MKSKEEIEQLAEQYIKDNTGDHYVYCGFVDGYTQCQEDMGDISKVTNVEIIHQYGAKYKRNNCKVELSYQDDGRTLKVFIKPLDKQD